MSQRKYDNKIKKEAKKLRLQGKTYSEIKDKLGIPKSTLCTWFRVQLKMPFNKNAQLEHLKKIRPLAAAAKKRINNEAYGLLKQKINKEVSNFPFNEIGFYKAMLSMLYWAEGGKYYRVSGLRFANTDPKLIGLYITLLRKCYNIDETKFHIRVHMHYYHKAKETKGFWSKILGIPKTQFGSSYVKKRSRKKRFRKNFMGICYVNYKDSNVRKEILEIGYRLQELITKENK